MAKIIVVTSGKGGVGKTTSAAAIATGLALAFGDTSGGFRRLIQIVFGLSIAFAASSFFLSFFFFFFFFFLSLVHFSFFLFFTFFSF